MGLVRRSLARGRGGDAPSLPSDLVPVGWSHAGQHAYVAGLGVVIPYALATFHSSYAVIGALLAVASVLGSLLQGLAVVARRVGARLLLTLQNVGSVIGVALGALAPTVLVFAAGRLLQSVAGWPQHPVGSAYLSARHPRRRGTVLSWHVTAGNVGTLIAPALVGVMISLDGWRSALWALAALLATTAVVTAVGVRGPWRQPPQPAPTTASAAEAHDLRRVLRSRPVVALLVAGTVAAGGQGIGIIGLYAPAYLHDALHASTVVVSSVLTVVYVGAVVGPILMGRLQDRLSHEGVLLANYVLGACALLAFVALGSSPRRLRVVGLLIGVFSYSELSLRQTVFADYVPGQLAREGFGVFFTISQTIGGVWVAVIGVVVAAHGFVPAFALMAATFLAAGLLVRIGTRSAPQGTP